MEFIKAIVKCNYITKNMLFIDMEEKNELEIENLEQKNACAHINFNESFRELIEWEMNHSGNGSCTNVCVWYVFEPHFSSIILCNRKR